MRGGLHDKVTVQSGDGADAWDIGKRVGGYEVIFLFTVDLARTK